MESGQGESDVAKMTWAVLEGQLTSGAFASLTGCTESRVESTMRDRASWVFGIANVVEISPRDL